MTQTLAFPLPSLANSLQSYIQAINKFPLLSAEEEYRLACRLRDHDDVEAAKTLVLSHLRVVVSVARNYLGYGLPQQDLIQEGNIGLMKAVKRFDPERGVRLVSFALHWVRAEIHEFVLRNWRLVKVATTKAQRKLFFNLRSMKKGVGNSLSPDEAKSIAKQLGVKPEEVLEMETRLSGQDIALDSSGPDDDESFSPIAYLTNMSSPHCKWRKTKPKRCVWKVCKKPSPNSMLVADALSKHAGLKNKTPQPCMTLLRNSKSRRSACGKLSKKPCKK